MREKRRGRRCARERLVAAAGAKRCPGVVRDLAGPDELPQRGQRGLGLEPGLGEQVGPEHGAAPERLADGGRLGSLRRRRAGGPAEQRRVLAEVDGDAVEPGADPDELAGGAERVERGGLVAGDAARQHLGLPERDRQREPLQRHERLAQGRAAADPVPGGQEAAEGRLLGRLDLAAQRGERGAPEAAEDVGVAPLALGATRTELAADEQIGALELVQETRTGRARSARLPRRS